MRTSCGIWLNCNPPEKHLALPHLDKSKVPNKNTDSDKREVIKYKPKPLRLETCLRHLAVGKTTNWEMILLQANDGITDKNAEEDCL